MIRVTHVEMVPGATIARGFGVDEDGRKVQFAGDWREMREIAFAIAAGEEPEADVPGWAILGIES